jgi:hypothetical protein
MNRTNGGKPLRSRFACTAVVCSLLLLPAPLPAQTYNSNRTTTAQNNAAYIVIGAVAAAVLVGFIVKHTHGGITVTGCVQSVGGTKTLVNEKDQRSYALIGSAADRVESGRLVTLKGKKEKASDGADALRVEATVTNLGTCTPAAQGLVPAT